MLWCYSYTIIREHINLCLLNLQLLKKSIKIHRCAVNTVVVWLHILGPYWCTYHVLFVPGDCVTVTPKHVRPVLM